MWKQEIEELHAVFESHFLGTTDSLERVEHALAEDFVIVGPDGNESGRKATLTAIAAGYGQAPSLQITVSDARLIVETAAMTVATYIETHQVGDSANHRRATVVFRRDESGPNGLRWLRVHETWIESSS